MRAHKCSGALRATLFAEGGSQRSLKLPWLAAQQLGSEENGRCKVASMYVACMCCPAGTCPGMSRWQCGGLRLEQMSLNFGDTLIR